ncbi:LCP family protein [Actinomyces trachealis]|uniref:LCP family protein n=1 Tax=Actinomyces trachealis TaxID=2763540 RepID=UPI0018928A42|nr:LCP family protein [Actinomyces trachealis]
MSESPQFPPLRPTSASADEAGKASASGAVADEAAALARTTRAARRRAEREAEIVEGLREEDEGRRSGRTWKVVLLAVLVTAFVLVGGVAVAGFWVKSNLTKSLETISDPFVDLPTRAPAQPVEVGEEPAVNILVLGSDSRISAGDPSQWQAGAQRTDAMMIVQIAGDRKSVTTMSIPRDSWVSIPGYGEAKINAAYSYGGPSLAIQTVEALTAVHIDHFVIADFESFAKMTDELGGVTINLKTPQTIAGTDFHQGAQKLNGEQALAYVRERKSLAGGDFDRVRRQQAWMRAIVRQIVQNGTLSDPPSLYSFLKVASASVAVDEGFSLDSMQVLAESLKNVGSGITFFTVPTSGTGMSADGQSIVLLDKATDEPIFKAFSEGKIHEYLEQHPDAVELLPATVN